MLENKVDITVYREMLGQTLTDRQWEVLAGYIEGSVEQYLEDNLAVWLDSIDELVAEESKYANESDIS